MKSFKQFMEGQKTCPKGQYYCFTDKKCKPIPKGYHVMGSGRLMQDDDHEDSEKKNGNGNGNGNGGAVSEAKKCWKGYKKVGTQKLFGKTYNRCVKASYEQEGEVVEANQSGDSSLRDWFSKSRSSDGKPGWVQLGGKYAGKPCAKQPGQKTKPKCGSSKMAASMSDKEEDAAAARKRREDPNPNRKGKAINVSTHGKKK